MFHCNQDYDMNDQQEELSSFCCSQESIENIFDSFETMKENIKTNQELICNQATILKNNITEINSLHKQIEKISREMVVFKETDNNSYFSCEEVIKAGWELHSEQEQFSNFIGKIETNLQNAEGFISCMKENIEKLKSRDLGRKIIYDADLQRFILQCNQYIECYKKVMADKQSLLALSEHKLALAGETDYSKLFNIQNIQNQLKNDIAHQEYCLNQCNLEIKNIENAIRTFKNIFTEDYGSIEQNLQNLSDRLANLQGKKSSLTLIRCEIVETQLPDLVEKFKSLEMEQEQINKMILSKKSEIENLVSDLNDIESKVVEMKNSYLLYTELTNSSANLSKFKFSEESKNFKLVDDLKNLISLNDLDLQNIKSPEIQMAILDNDIKSKKALMATLNENLECLDSDILNMMKILSSIENDVEQKFTKIGNMANVAIKEGEMLEQLVLNMEKLYSSSKMKLDNLKEEFEMNVVKSNGLQKEVEEKHDSIKMLNDELGMETFCNAGVKLSLIENCLADVNKFKQIKNLLKVVKEERENCGKIELMLPEKENNSSISLENEFQLLKTSLEENNLNNQKEMISLKQELAHAREVYLKCDVEKDKSDKFLASVQKKIKLFSYREVKLKSYIKSIKEQTQFQTNVLKRKHSTIEIKEEDKSSQTQPVPDEKLFKPNSDLGKLNILLTSQKRDNKIPYFLHENSNDGKRIDSKLIEEVVESFTFTTEDDFGKDPGNQLKQIKDKGLAVKLETSHSDDSDYFFRKQMKNVNSAIIKSRIIHKVQSTQDYPDKPKLSLETIVIDSD